MIADQTVNKVRRNLVIRGKRTSLSLEAVVWDALTEMCRREEISLDEICEKIIAKAKTSSMSSAIRVHVLNYFRVLAA